MTSTKDLMREVRRQSGKTVDDSFVEEVSNPSRQATLMKRMERASSFGKLTGRCGETMEIYLCIDGEQITDTSFFTVGCRFSVVCGAVAALLARGKTIDTAAGIDGDTILGMLQGIPEEESHCARLAAETLQEAIHNWLLKR